MHFWMPGINLPPWFLLGDHYTICYKLWTRCALLGMCSASFNTCVNEVRVLWVKVMMIFLFWDFCSAWDIYSQYQTVLCLCKEKQNIYYHQTLTSVTYMLNVALHIPSNSHQALTSSQHIISFCYHDQESASVDWMAVAKATCIQVSLHTGQYSVSQIN